MNHPLDEPTEVSTSTAGTVVIELDPRQAHVLGQMLLAHHELPHEWLHPALQLLACAAALGPRPTPVAVPLLDRDHLRLDEPVPHHPVYFTPAEWDDARRGLVAEDGAR